MNRLPTLLLAAVFTAAALMSQTLAQTCVTPPSCEELGYTLSADDCINMHVLKCPFDKNKLYCNNFICPDSYNLTTCPNGGTCDWCGNKASLKSCNIGYFAIDNSCGLCSPCSLDSFDPMKGYQILRYFSVNSNNCLAPTPNMVIEIIYTCSNYETYSKKIVPMQFSTQEECQKTVEFIENIYNVTPIAPDTYNFIYKHTGVCPK